ncbi:MAG: cadmium-translocating P-type ATPase [Chloroflexota bacterium]
MIMQTTTTATPATAPDVVGSERSADGPHRPARHHDAERRGRLLHAGLTTLCLISLLTGAALQAASIGPSWLWWLLAATSFISGGAFATKNAVEELLSGGFNVDLLMISAALGAAALGHWQEGGVLLFLFSLSGTLEEFAMGRTRQAIRALMSLAPEEALVRREGIEQRIPVEQVQVGDTVIVKPGERIAADGVVLAGVSAVDQSAMTGESMPVEVQPGSFVHAGTINLHGSLEVRATRPAAETTLAKIIRLVEEAQEQKSPTQRFTDWFGQRYTIGVIAAALGMAVLPPFLLGWSWETTIYRAMTLLVVASPCALVISTPATVLSAIAHAARHGILFKGGAHLESAGRCRAVIFDKTGTLTQGQAEITDIMALPGSDETAELEVLRLAAAAEQRSDHPLAQAIVVEARRRGLEVPSGSNMQAAHGKGVRAEVDGYEVLVGNERFFAQYCLAVPGDIQQQPVRRLCWWECAALAARSRAW